MNAGLGNRDGYRPADAASNTGGRVTLCPLCLQGPNNELHVTLRCKALYNDRISIQVGNFSPEETMEAIKELSGVLDDIDALRTFLRNEKLTRKEFLKKKGLDLDLLLDKFFAKCNKVNSRAVVRTILI